MVINPGLADPSEMRLFSLLPDEDADEAFCFRHAREMLGIEPIVHSDGALYTTGDSFSVYSCPNCVQEISVTDHDELPDDGMSAYKRELVECFGKWDRGDAFDGWFQYVSEGSITDTDSGDPFVTVDSQQSATEDGENDE